MTDDTLVSSHSAELVQGKHPVYRVFDVLQAADMDVERRRQLQSHTAALIDFLFWQQIPVTPEVLCAGMQRALDQKTMDPVQFVRCWRKAVESALPSRAACHAVLTSFADYCDRLPPELRQAFARGLAPLCMYVANWGPRKTEGLLRTLGSVGSSDRVDVLLKAVATYAQTDARIMHAAVNIAARLLAADRNYLLDVLIQEVPVERMMESRDACRLLPALQAAMETADAQNPAYGPTVAACVLSIAKLNISSAYDTARKLRKTCGKMPADRYDAYVRQVEKLAGKGELRLLGFCLHELPRLTRQYSAESVAEFVNVAAAITSAYGIHAAELFLRRETHAARSVLRPV